MMAKLLAIFDLLDGKDIGPKLLALLNLRGTREVMEEYASLIKMVILGFLREYYDDKELTVSSQCWEGVWVIDKLMEIFDAHHSDIERLTRELWDQQWTVCNLDVAMDDFVSFCLGVGECSHLRNLLERILDHGRSMLTRF